MVLCLISSCEKFLEEKTYGQQTPEEFYTNPAEAEDALLGIISYYSGNANYDQLVVEEYMTDNVLYDAARVLKSDSYLQFSSKDIKVTNTVLETVYSNLYSSIYNCNSYIENLENSTWSSSNEDQRPQYIAEGYTLRAMAYFHLVRLFGAVPLIVTVEDSSPDGPIRIGRTAIDTVYMQIIDDLKKAKALYTQEDARSPGYASKILCRLLLAKVYLTMNGEPLKLGTEYLQAARAEADTLIYAKATGIAVPDLVKFSDLFSVANENEGEILFSGQNYGTGTGQIFATGEYSYGALSYSLISEFNTSGSVDLTNSNRQIINVNPNTSSYDISLYTDASKFIDGRYYPTFWPYKGNWNSTTKALPNFYNVMSYLTTPSKYTSETINKTVFPGKYRSDYEYKAGENAAYPHYDKKANIVMYRWAEAFLIFAEADNELNGPQSGAIEAVNKIRRRAALVDLPSDQTDTKENFRTAIRKEWRLEFVTEGKHFYNLQRWGTLIDQVNDFINDYNAYNSSYPMTLLVKGKNELYPIPFTEIDRTGFTQNSGY